MVKIKADNTLFADDISKAFYSSIEKIFTTNKSIICTLCKTIQKEMGMLN